MLKFIASVSGLCPGESYGIELKTKTGSRFTRKPLYETVLTRPAAAESCAVDSVTATAAVLRWVGPDTGAGAGHKRLRAYNIHLVSADQKLRRELAVSHSADTAVNTFLMTALSPGSRYTATITCVCVFETLKTESEEQSLRFSTLPEPPTNLVLDTRSTNNFTVKWDASPTSSASHKYRLTVEAATIAYAAEYTVAGDKGTFNFSKLPEIVGTGM